MSLSPTTPAGPTPTGSGRWLLRGRSPLWLIGLSALCGVGLSAAGMMLMRAADGAGVKDVVAELRRSAAPGRTAAPAGRTQPARAGGAPPAAAPESVAQVPAETAMPVRPASPASDPAAPSGPPEPTQTATISPAAPPPSPPKNAANQPVVASQSPPAPSPVASMSTNAVPAPPKPTPVQTANVNPPTSPVREGSVIKREALSPVKPQRAATRTAPSLPAADGQAGAVREPAASHRTDAVVSAPAGMRTIAAPAGSGANVRAYTMDGGQNSSGSRSGVRVVRVEVPGSR